MRVKVIRVDRIGGPDVLQPAEGDAPQVQAGELLIRQTAVGVNYIDVYLRTGAYPHALPFVPGREGVGVVEALGPGVAGFTPGMRVGYPESPNLGSYAECVTVPARFCVEVPAGVEDAVACGAMLQALTAQYLATDSYKIGPGDHVLIHAAAGGVGRVLVQLAKRRGAVVIATAGGAEKTALAKSAGADHAIDYRSGFIDQVKDLTGGRGVDIVYDPIGDKVADESLRCLAWGGRLLILGFLGGGPTNIRSNYLLIKGIDAVGVRIGGLNEANPALAIANMKALIALAEQGKLRPRISHTFRLEQAAEALQVVIDRAVIGKAVLLS